MSSMSSSIEKTTDTDDTSPTTPPENHESTRENNENESPTDDEDDTTSSSDSGSSEDEPLQLPRKKHLSFTHRMLNLCKELGIALFVLAFYTALTTETPPKVSKGPAAYPFFPLSQDLITDWYKGQISQAIEQARASDVSFVMFYAPWDAESQAARAEFMTVARVLQDRVTFASVNCWQPGSECRRQYSKVYRWPVFIAYPTHGRGVQYNGPIEWGHMVRFLRNVMSPVILARRINDNIGRHDALVVGNVDVLPGSLDYAVFYLTALRFLEKDPFRDVAFVVLPTTSSSNSSTRLRLYLWNETIAYNSRDFNDPDLLVGWIFKRVRRVTSWVTPSGGKSLKMSNLLQPGPSLVVFTPRNILLEQVDYYNMVKEVAYEYNNCGNNDVVKLKQQIIQAQRLRNHYNFLELKKHCLSDSHHHQTNFYKTQNIHNKIWANSTPISIPSICGTPIDKTLEETDTKSPEQLQKIHETDKCKFLFLSHKYSRPIFETTTNTTTPTKKLDITGLGCGKNLSLSIFLMDSLRYSEFANRLGVDLSKTYDRTAAVIIDERTESHYVMGNVVAMTGESLRAFIGNYTTNNGKLRRSTSSPLIPQQKTPDNNNKSRLVVVNEITTSQQFHSHLFQNNRTKDRAHLVFYYSKQCAFCSGISHAFLQTARILSQVEDLEFSRVNGDLVLLPWEFTMERYPTVLFFPRRNKGESRALSNNKIPITVPNLVGFVLTNLDPVLRLQTMWVICNQTEFEAEKSQCMTSLRIYTTSLIDKNLKEWRISHGNEPRQNYLLRKLQMLRNLHLFFAHSPHNNKVLKYFDVLLHDEPKVYL